MTYKIVLVSLLITWRACPMDVQKQHTAQKTILRLDPQVYAALRTRAIAALEKNGTVPLQSQPTSTPANPLPQKTGSYMSSKKISYVLPKKKK